LGPKQFVQNGILVKLNMGEKIIWAGVFLPKFPVKKAVISYNEWSCIIVATNLFMNKDS